MVGKNVTVEAARKLMVLIPRLASTFDGEVVATVKAIQRTLRGSGLDWHDLTKGLVAITEREIVVVERWEPIDGRWRSDVRALLFSDNPLSDWENEFLNSVLARRRPLTERQREILTRIMREFGTNRRQKR